MERERQNEKWKTEAQEEESKVSFHILDRVSIFLLLSTRTLFCACVQHINIF